jgi:hypothetical protein
MKSKTAKAVTTDGHHAVVESESAQPWHAGAPTQQEIRLRAYELHVAGGCVHGRDQDDWLQAERELIEKYGER